MSRHRAPTVLDAGSTGLATPPAGVLGELVGGTDLERWYGLVLAFPDTAARILNAHRVPDPVMRAALQAQTALRLNKARVAAAYAREAVQFAAGEDPVVPDRLLPAVTILTDAAVLAGASDAAASCLDLTALSQRFGDEQRHLLALGLEAVAVFHQRSCREAARLLAALSSVAREVPDVGAAATTASAALTASCAQRRQPHWPPISRPLMTACGWVPYAVTEQFLADRLVRWPGIHDCATAPAGRRA